jgi:hypothetical protein
LLCSLADLVGDLGADLVIEKVLEREPSAGQIEENLVEAALLVRFAGQPILPSAVLSCEVLGEYCPDQLARRNSPVSRRLLDPLQQLRRQADGVWNFRHRTALNFFTAYTAYTPMNPRT